MTASKRSTFQLAVLTFIHLVVDFYGGLLIPLPEPTLVNHYLVGLGTVAFLVGGSAVLINATQPIAGWLLPKCGLPVLMVLCPIVSAGIALMGMSRSLAFGAALVIVAGIGIGVLHPEATLTAHHLAGRRKGLGVSVFLSGGYFGFALGSLVAGTWVKYHPGMEKFWLLALPALLAALLGLVSGLHKVKGHVSEENRVSSSGTSYLPVLLMGLCIASTMLLMVRLIPIYFVRLFPDKDGQFWGAVSVSVTGISGALGAYVWGYLSDRWGCTRMILLAQIVGLPFLYGFFHVSEPELGPWWAAATGATVGGVFPLTVVLARGAKGFTRRLRMGLAIGATWGMGEVFFILAGNYIGRFPSTDLAAVARSLNFCWALVIGGLLLASLVWRQEERLSQSG